MIIILSVVFLFFLFYFLKHCRSRNDDEPLDRIPGPRGVPILGYLPFMDRKVHITLTELWRKYGDVYKIRIGSRTIVILNGNDTIRRAFVEKAIEFSGRPNFYTYEVASKGSLIGLADYSERCRTAKKILLKSFGNFLAAKKCELQSVAHKSVEQLLNVVKGAKNRPFDPNPHMYPIICIIMGYICWGEFFDIDDEAVKEILGTAQEFGNAMAFGVACDYFPFLKRFFERKLANLERLMDTNKQISCKLAQKHVESYDGLEMRDITDFFHKVSDEDQYKLANLNLSKTDFLSIPGGMFGAGFATISITTKWAILLLAKFPEYQKKMQQELDDVVGSDRYPIFDDMENLSYCMAVINEVYRYSSIAHIAFAHKTTCDTKINEYELPKDTTIIANFYSSHRDPKYFGHPDRFNPERFLSPDGTLNKSLMEKVTPYGLGTRRCGAETVARLEIFTFIATLIQRCHISECDDLPLDLHNYKTTVALDPCPFKVLFKSRYGEW